MNSPVEKREKCKLPENEVLVEDSYALAESVVSYDLKIHILQLTLLSHLQYFSVH